MCRHRVLLRAMIAASIVVLASFVPGEVQTQEADSMRVVLRFHPTRDETAQRRVLETLAHYLEPKRVEAPAGTTVTDLIRAECGTATEAHLDVFRRLNAEVTGGVLDQPTTVLIPPCPRWKADAATVLSEWGSVADQVAVVTGIAGPKTLTAVKELNPSLRDRRLMDPAPSLAGRTIRLPYASFTTSWVLKPLYQARTEEVVASIQAAPGALSVDVDEGRVDLVTDVAPANSIASCGTSTLPDRPWPYAPSDVLAVLRHNRSVFGPHARRPWLPMLIGIGDTGIEEGELRLPLHYSEVERHGPEDEDVDKNGYPHDVIGVNMPERRGFPRAQAGYGRRGHGTEVAALAAGGIVPDDLEAEVRSRLALRILSIVRRIGLAESIFTFPEHGIAELLRYQPDNRALAVANLSIQSPTRLESFRKELEHTSTLVVIAAGNDGKDLERYAIYPAWYRTQYPNRVITVASHNPIDSSGRRGIRQGSVDATSLAALSRFSNYGTQSVDLAAPGCMIQTLEVNEGRAVVNGTSFAAPLVSFTAALLMSEGIMEPERVRSRILASVDVVPGLPVYTGGILNISKALSVFEDIVQLRTGELLRGRIFGLTGITIGGEVFERRQLLKIVPPLSRAFVFGPEERLVIRSGPVEVWHESAPTGRIVLRETSAATDRIIELHDIADIVLAAPEYRHIGSH